jgi:hypothetical protein
MYFVKLYGYIETDRKQFAESLAPLLGIPADKIEYEILDRLPYVVAQFQDRHTADNLLEKLRALGALSIIESLDQEDAESVRPPVQPLPTAPIDSPEIASGITWLQIIGYVVAGISCIAILYYAPRISGSGSNQNTKPHVNQERVENLQPQSSMTTEDTKEALLARLKVMERNKENITLDLRAAQDALETLLTTPGSDPKQIRDMRSRVALLRSEAQSIGTQYDQLRAALDRL